MYDEHGNIDWEHGDNRKVNLLSVGGTKVVIEDDGWNQKDTAANVIVLETNEKKEKKLPTKPVMQSLDQEIEEFTAKMSAEKIKEKDKVVG